MSCFGSDNVATFEKKVVLFRSIGELLRPGGAMVNLVSTPEIYTREWASFSTKDSLENMLARAGDVVRIVMLDVADRRPVEDIVWSDDAYRQACQGAGLHAVEVHRPLARTTEEYKWVSETTIAPWRIYMLRPAASCVAGPNYWMLDI